MFVLGEDEPGRLFDLVAGDHAEVVQDTDLTDVALVRAHLRLRVPASLPGTHFWEASIVVDGVKRATATGRPGRSRRVTDLAANVETALAEIVDALEGDHYRGNETNAGQHRTIHQPNMGTGKVLLWEAIGVGTAATHLRV